MNNLLNCNLCPRKCNVNRYKTTGFCGASNEMVIAYADLFFYEEPIISCKNGSGAIFFSYCNMKCIFCQNYDISTNHIGKKITIRKLSEIMLNLEKRKAHNINLVTPTHYEPLVKKSIIMAKKNGLSIPIIYNTSSYDSVDTIKDLNGLIDIYLPDLKYYDDNLAIKYSSAKDYFKYACLAIDEMYMQVGKPTIKNGILLKGIVIRHLLLPGHLDDSKKIIKYIYDKYKDNVYISIMNQYTPIRKLEYKNLNRCVFDSEYNELIDYAVSIGVSNAFAQVGDTQKKSFIPDFKNQDF